MKEQRDETNPKKKLRTFERRKYKPLLSRENMGLLSSISEVNNGKING